MNVARPVMLKLIALYIFYGTELSSTLQPFQTSYGRQPDEKFYKSNMGRFLVILRPAQPGARITSHFSATSFGPARRWLARNGLSSTLQESGTNASSFLKLSCFSSTAVRRKRNKALRANDSNSSYNSKTQAEEKGKKWSKCWSIYLGSC